MLMTARSALLLAAAGASSFLATSPAAAQPLRLEEQRVEGVARLCQYRSMSRVETRRVGRGEPCPPTYRRPVQVRPQIPSYATLQRRGYEAGRPVCVYAYQQREYRQAASAAGYCPYTPTASPLRQGRSQAAD